MRSVWIASTAGALAVVAGRWAYRRVVAGDLLPGSVDRANGPTVGSDRSAHRGVPRTRLRCDRRAVSRLAAVARRQDPGSGALGGDGAGRPPDARPGRAGGHDHRDRALRASRRHPLPALARARPSRPRTVRADRGSGRHAPPLRGRTRDRPMGVWVDGGEGWLPGVGKRRCEDPSPRSLGSPSCAPPDTGRSKRRATGEARNDYWTNTRWQ